MKKSIYELMENAAPNELPEYSVSAKRVKELAMKKIESEKKPGKIRMSAAAIAAAAAVAAAGITVIAYETGFAERAAEFFAGREKIVRTEEGYMLSDETLPVSTEDIFGIEENIREKSVSAESGGTVIELQSAMHDERTAYLFFRLTAPEGTVLNEDDYEFDRCSMDIETQPTSAASWSLSFEEASDNELYFACELYCSGNACISGLNGIRFKDLIIEDKHEENRSVVLEGEWYIPVEMNTPVKVMELIDEPTEITFTAVGESSPKTAVFKSVRLSPLSVTVKTGAYGSVPITVVMKDKTVTEELIPCGKDVYRFQRPVDTENIDCVVIGNTSLPVS